MNATLSKYLTRKVPLDNGDILQHLRELTDILETYRELLVEPKQGQEISSQIASLYSKILDISRNQHKNILNTNG